MNSLVAVAAPKIFKWAKSAIKDDLRQRYDLLETWFLPHVDVSRWQIPDTETDTLCFIDNVPFVKPYHNTKEMTHCNGSTLSPERCIVPTTVGALVHDIAYDLIEYCAHLWGWSEAEVRRLFDEIFGNVLMSLAYQIKNPIKRRLAIMVARTYFTVVRGTGGIAHYAFKLFATLAICISATMVTSCAVPKLWNWDATMDDPVYTNVTDKIEP